METIFNGTILEAIKLVAPYIILLILFYLLGVITALPSKKEKDAFKRIRTLEERVGMDTEMLAAAKLMMEDAATQQTRQSQTQNWL